MKAPKSIVLLLAVTLVTGNASMISANSQTRGTVSNVLAGQDRIETAIEISEKGWTTSEEAILVNDSSIPDALSSTPFADARKAPVLLTGKSAINEKTKVELKRLGVRKVYLIGGENSLNKKIEEELKSDRIIVDRIFGDDRYKTSVEIAKKVDQIYPISEIAVVNGDKGLVDAVSVGAVAANKKMPVILTNKISGNIDADNFIKGKSMKQSYVIGGEAGISKDMENKLPNPKRISGNDRSETNAKVISEFYTNVKLNNAYITKDGSKRENDIIDSLAVGSLAAKNSSPIIIVGDKLGESQKTVTNTKSFANITRVGGNGNEQAFKELESLQAVTTFDAKTLAEFKEFVAKADANDVINFKPKNGVNEEINVSSNYFITINLYGTYTKAVNINVPNGVVSNNGSSEGSNPGGGGGSSTGGGGSSGSEITEGKIKASVRGDGAVIVEMKKVEGIEFSISGNGYNGKVESHSYRNGRYLLNLDKPLGKNCEHELTIKVNNKEFKKTIMYKVVNSEYLHDTYFEEGTLTVSTDKDSSEFKNIVIKSGERTYILTYSGGRWISEDGLNVVNNKYGKTTVLSITNSADWNPTNVTLECKEKVEYPDGASPKLSISVSTDEKGYSTIECYFDEEINIKDSKNNNKLSNLELTEKLEIYIKDGDLDKLIDSTEIDWLYKDKNILEFKLKGTNNFEKGNYIIRIKDAYIEDLSENRVDYDIEFKIGAEILEVATEEELKSALKKGARKIILGSDELKLTGDLIIPENINVVIGENKTLDLNGNKLIIEGSITGDGSVSDTKNSEPNVELTKRGLLFKPEITEVNNANKSTIEIKNVTADSIKSILVSGNKFNREIGGIYTTTGFSMITLKEIKNPDNSNVRVEITTAKKLNSDQRVEVDNNTIENEVITNGYEVKVVAVNNVTVENKATFNSEITFEVDKSSLISKILDSKRLHSNAIEGTETGQYIVGSKDELRKAIEIAENVMKKEDSSQSEIYKAESELYYAVDLFKESKIPKKATNMQELKNGLAYERKLMVSEDIVVTEDLTVPNGCTLIIDKGTTLNIERSTLNVNGRVIINGKVTENGTVNLGKQGVFGKAFLNETTAETSKEISTVEILNIGKNAIQSIKVGETEYTVYSDKLYTSTNPQGVITEFVEVVNKKENKYNATPELYLKIYTPYKENMICDIVVRDIFNNETTINMPITFWANKSELIKEIQLARELYNVTVEGENNAEFEVGSKAIYDEEIKKAEAVRDNIASTGSEIRKAGYELKKATRTYKEKMVIPKVNTLSELRKMLEIMYVDKIIVTSTIENTDQLKVPVGMNLEILEGAKLVNKSVILLDGRITGDGAFEGTANSNVTLGEEGVLLKATVKDISTETESNIKISNVGVKAIRGIYVDGVKFYDDGGEVYATTWNNAKSIEIRNIEGYKDTLARVNPSKYVTITSKRKIDKSTVFVEDKYEQYGDPISINIIGREK
ncbi:cell wall-binding repeat-containing protein [Metaclostridioides mangenotii]|uniref:cell wall-binding repeat-containing protein n=1 Tax=Metaclostridioides mangenotii TaxID=1540 RepID=UPI0026EA2CA5|nr:cell wall-binding repeat-containing protein [Clostridioides mangenotii]